MEPARLRSRRLLLEPLRAEHVEVLVPLLADPALHRFTGGEPPDRAALRARVARQVSGRSPDGRDRWLNWVASRRDNGDTVGTLQATVAPGGEALLAWVIGTAHQGQGLSTEAAAAVAAWLRAQGVTRLAAHIHPGHEASMAVARAIGLHPTETVVDGEVRWESG